MSKLLITSYPFGINDKNILASLQRNNIKYDLNPYKREDITSEEINDLISDYDIVIAGTESLGETFHDNAKNLKLIVRLGVGIDNVNKSLCQKNKIAVSCTPTAPSYGVAEFTMSAILESLKKISYTDRLMRSGLWERSSGSLLRKKTIGIMGFGRVGKILSSLLQPFHVQILAYDLVHDNTFPWSHNVKFVSLQDLLKDSDVISIHVSLNQDTHHMMDYKKFSLCKQNPILINTSRGSVISEKCLSDSLRNGIISHAFLDTFETEPYNGEFLNYDNVTLTSHIASSSKETRNDMEEEAVNNVISFIKNNEINNRVY